MANFNVIRVHPKSGKFKLGGTDKNDAMIGSTGRDILNSGVGEDLIAADAGNDLILGGSGNDTLRGGLGADILFGGKDDDRLIGGGDADRFLLSSGNDVIVDYDASDGDKIGIAFLTNYRFKQIGADVKVLSDQGETTIQNVELVELTVINKGQIVDLSLVD